MSESPVETLEKALGPHLIWTGVLTSLNKVEFRIAIPAVTREYTPRSGRNSGNPMKHTPRWEMRLDFPAFRAEHYRIPN